MRAPTFRPYGTCALLPLLLLAACGPKSSERQPSADSVQSDVGAVAPAPATTGPTPPPAFAVCMSCHSVQPGQNRVGPSLAGIYGSKAGAVPGYAFSPVLAQSGITWDAKALDTWLQGPMKMVPGTKMVMAVPDAQRRQAIITYLETLK